MEYIDKRNTQVVQLHTILCNEIPEFLYKYLETPEVLRLNNISQHCGMDYLKIPYIKPNFFYSRLDHSLGVALIIWNFTKDKKQTLSGLFHDISTPVFGHVIDFLNGDHINQEFTEIETENIIRDSNQILECLREDNLSVQDVCDYKLYPIADNKSPRLSSDRLEYSFVLQIVFNSILNFDDINNIYNDLTVLKNEDGIDELGFSNLTLAKNFFDAVKINGDRMSCNEDKYSMEFLAKILQIMIDNNEILQEELYKISEKDIINRIESSKTLKVRGAWNHFCNLEKVYLSENKLDNQFSVNFKVKKRYIDSIVYVDGRNIRLSSSSSDIKNEINEFLDNSKNSYISSGFCF